MSAELRLCALLTLGGLTRCLVALDEVGLRGEALGEGASAWLLAARDLAALAPVELPALYPLVVAVLHGLGLSLPWAGVGASMLAVSLLPGLCLGVLRDLGSPLWVAGLGGLACLAVGSLYEGIAWIDSGSTVAAGCLGLALLGLRSRRAPSLRRSAVLGLVGGLVAHGGPVGLGCLVLVAAALAPWKTGQSYRLGDLLQGRPVSQQARDLLCLSGGVVLWSLLLGAPGRGSSGPAHPLRSLGAGLDLPTDTDLSAALATARAWKSKARETCRRMEPGDVWAGEADELAVYCPRPRHALSTSPHPADWKAFAVASVSPGWGWVAVSQLPGGPGQDALWRLLPERTGELRPCAESQPAWDSAYGIGSPVELTPPCTDDPRSGQGPGHR